VWGPRDAYLSAVRNLRWQAGETRTPALGDDAGVIGAAYAAFARCGTGRDVAGIQPRSNQLARDWISLRLNYGLILVLYRFDAPAG
jgi:hypothetical protein